MAVFNQKKNSDASIPAPAAPAVANQSSLIGNTLLIKGEVFSEDEILIEGRIQGKITVKNRVIIGVNGNVEADVEAREVVIKGKVTGNVKGGQRVEIVPSGILHGNINSPRVVIADSGVFEGNIEMHGRDEKNKGREDSPAAIHPPADAGEHSEEQEVMASPIKGGAKTPSWFLLLETEPRRAAENMARDEYLFRLCHENKRGFFRIYAWERPSFSTGVSQKAEKALNLDFIKANGCDYVRRITGGKTVLHDHEITYAVVSSEDLFFKEHDLHQSYLLISRVLVQALRSLDVPAVLSQGSPAELSRSHNPCFSFPTPNEIEVNGKKIIGSAQKRDKQALLQHGSIPLTMNYELYAGGAKFRPEPIARSMTTWNDISRRDPSELITALVQSFRTFIGMDFAPLEFGPEDERQITALTEKYSSDAWNLVL